MKTELKGQERRDLRRKAQKRRKGKKDEQIENIGGDLE